MSVPFLAGRGQSQGTLQNAAAANGTGIALPLEFDASCVMTVSGTFVGTVTFEGTEDGTTWVTLPAAQLGASSALTPSTTTPGDFWMSVANLQAVRAHILNYVSGSITVTAHASSIPWSQPTASGNAGAAVALSSPPTALSASADTAFPFASQVNHVFVQNKSATPVYVNFDAVATLGSMVVPANGGVLNGDTSVTTVHIYGTAATNVNGSADANIILKGWS